MKPDIISVLLLEFGYRRFLQLELKSLSHETEKDKPTKIKGKNIYWYLFCWIIIKKHNIVN